MSASNPTDDSKLMKDWNQNELISWIKSLKADDSFSEKVKQDIIAGINKYSQEESAVTGEDFYEAETPDDIKELTMVNGKKSRNLFKRIAAKKQEEFDTKESEGGGGPGRRDNDNSNDEFTLNVIGSQGKSTPIKHCTKTMTIARVKEEYLRAHGKDTEAHKYAANKWDKNEKISLKYNGKPLKDNKKTLEYYDITDGLSPIWVAFRVIGGANENKEDEFKVEYQKGTEKELNYDSDDDDQYRKRVLRCKKYKFIVKSQDPDCIMGYTNADGIARAKMPCGCSFTSDTMWRFMRSTFEKDYKAIKMYCPVPKKECKGNAQQRHWKWSLVFAVADLSEKEKIRYSKIINNRVSGSKTCPHCNSVTERPDDLRIWRVRCLQCNGSKGDWCWQCGGDWKGSGWGSICGNSGCMGAKLNQLLENCDRIIPTYGWAKDKNGEKCEVPEMRACPKCLSLIEYTSACQHMTCLGCPHEFCFKCLSKWQTCTYCGADKENKCEFAPIQVFE